MRALQYQEERDVLDNGVLGSPSPLMLRISRRSVGAAFVASPCRKPATQHLTVFTFCSGVRMRLRASALLADERVRMRVVDLRWLMPLPIDDMVGEESSARRERLRRPHHPGGQPQQLRAAG